MAQENNNYTRHHKIFGYDFLGDLSHSGDLLLWVGVCRRALTSSSQELLGQS